MELMQTVAVARHFNDHALEMVSESGGRLVLCWDTVQRLPPCLLLLPRPLHLGFVHHADGMHRESSRIVITMCVFVAGR